MPSAGARRTEKLQAILAATEQLMLEQGYGSVTYRSVAAKAGVAAGLVQYYFPSLDDLFVGVLRSGTDRVIEGLEDAARSEHPLRALWEYANNRSGTALLMEFMALANHRPGVGEVIGEGGERVRCAVVEAVSGRWPDYGLDEDALPPPRAGLPAGSYSADGPPRGRTWHFRRARGDSGSGRAIPGSRRTRRRRLTRTPHLIKAPKLALCLRI